MFVDVCCSITWNKVGNDLWALLEVLPDANPSLRRDHSSGYSLEFNL